MVVEVTCINNHVQIFRQAAGSNVGFGSSYGIERDCLLSDQRSINNDLRNDDNFEVWEYRDDGRGNCRGGLYGKFS